jgi:hypothetical protein
MFYWVGLSLGHARDMIFYYTGLQITKSQADKLLYQLSHDWEAEYAELASFIAVYSSHFKIRFSF